MDWIDRARVGRKVVGPCEHDNETSSSIKCREFEELSASQEGLCSMVLVI